MTKTDKTEWVKVKDVMELLDVSRPVVTGLIHEGKLDGFKIGKAGSTSAYRIEKRSLEAYIEAQREASS